MFTFRNAFLTYLMPILTIVLLGMLVGIAFWNYTQLDTLYDGMVVHEAISNKIS